MTRNKLLLFAGVLLLMVMAACIMYSPNTIPTNTTPALDAHKYAGCIETTNVTPVASDNLSQVANLTSEHAKHVEYVKTVYVDGLKKVRLHKAAEKYAACIRREVKNGNVSWEEIGINDSQLAEKEKIIWRMEAQSDMTQIRLGASYKELVEYDRVVREAVKANITDWEKLEIKNSSDYNSDIVTIKDYEAVVNNSKRLSILNSLSDLQTTEDEDSAESDRDQINQAVSDGFISWEELNISRQPGCQPSKSLNS